MFCVKCGNKVSDSALFCFRCGNRLNRQTDDERKKKAQAEETEITAVEKEEQPEESKITAVEKEEQPEESKIAVAEKEEQPEESKIAVAEKEEQPEESKIIAVKEETKISEMEVNPEIQPPKVKMKKWNLIFPIVAVWVVLVIVWLLTSQLIHPSQQKVLEAYKEFYHEFYNENVGIEGFQDVINDDGDIVVSTKDVIDQDCGGKIIMAPNGSLMLSVTDFTYLDATGKNSLADIYLFSYERGKVIEKSVLRNIMPDDLCAFFIINNALYFIYENIDDSIMDVSEWEIYKYNQKKGKLEKIRWKLKDDVKDTDVDKLSGHSSSMAYYETEDGISYEEIMIYTTSGYEYPILYDVRVINGNSFEGIIDDMSEIKIRTPEALQLFWSKKVIPYFTSPDTELSEHIVVAITETDDAYYGIDLEEHAILVGIKDHEITDVSKLLKSAGDIEVTGIDAQSFRGCNEITTIKIPDNITYITNTFSYCTSLSELEIPNSVEELTGVGILDSVLVYCNKGSTAEEYAIENEWFYVNGTIASADKSEVERVKQKMNASE